MNVKLAVPKQQLNTVVPHQRYRLFIMFQAFSKLKPNSQARNHFSTRCINFFKGPFIHCYLQIRREDLQHKVTYARITITKLSSHILFVAADGFTKETAYSGFEILATDQQIKTIIETTEELIKREVVFSELYMFTPACLKSKPDMDLRYWNCALLTMFLFQKANIISNDINPNFFTVTDIYLLLSSTEFYNKKAFDIPIRNITGKLVPSPINHYKYCMMQKGEEGEEETDKKSITPKKKLAIVPTYSSQV